MHFIRLALFGLCLISFKSIHSQPLWTDIEAERVDKFNDRYAIPEKYRLIRADFHAIKSLLERAPLENSGSGIRVSFPLPDGENQEFEVFESTIMEAGLAAKFPHMRTYTGKSTGIQGSGIRISITDLGIHTMIRTGSTSYFMDPVFQFEKTNYICYEKSDFHAARSFECHAADDDRIDRQSQAAKSHGTQLRTYRLAVAATGEYTAFYGGTVSGALSGIVATINRVNGVYEDELAVRLTLIANNNLIIYTSSGSDPYTNNNGSTMLGQNQSNLDAVIGDANYDIGHVFSTGGGGIASLGVPCRTTFKARGVTGSPSPVGDAFDIDYVAHEMGHQFGANHTFNSATGNCAGGNRNASTAFEPGSGITIMAYAGICGSDDLAPHSIAYFHTKSFEEITNYITGVNGNSCPVITNTGNTPPVVNAGTDHAIPISTPFVLTGSATDANGDALFYSWEEMDLGPAGAWNFQSAGNDAPLFRPFPPVTTPSRTFPKLSDIINNTTTIGEVLPAFARVMDFRLTARDNRNGGGGVTYNDVTRKITVVSTGGPFTITFPNTAMNLIGGNPATVTWNVAGTTLAPVSTSHVKISLSTDGGNTFPTVLAATTPNDGSEQVIIPNITTTQARIKVEAVGNIFFDMSNANFSIVPPSPVITLIITENPSVSEYCAGDSLYASFLTDGPALAGNVFSVQLSNAAGSFASPVVIGFQASTGAVTIGCVIPPGTVAGNGYKIRVISSNPSVTGSPCSNNLVVNQMVSPVISSNGSTTVCEPSEVQLTFTPLAGQQYQWLLNGAEIPGANGSTYEAGLTGNYSIRTTEIFVPQQTFFSSGSVSIPDNSCSITPGSIAVTGYTQTVPSQDITITINITHTWVGDLVLFLEAPNGQILALSNRTGNSNNGGDNFTNTIFSDAGATQIPTSGAPYTGTYKPWTSLVNLSACSISSNITTFGSIGGGNINPNGTWRLRAYDRANSDNGSITNWSITFPGYGSSCTSVSNSISVTVNPQINISSFSPDTATAGDTVQITGSGFINVTSVEFNGLSSSYEVINSGLINAIVPAGPAQGYISVEGACGSDTATTQLVVINTVLLNLELYIEGFYTGGGTMNAAAGPHADTITVQLVSPSGLQTIAYSQSVVLSTSGTASVQFPAAVAGNAYYVVIRQRNTLETWSKNPVLFGSVTNFNFKN